ncbi:MAG TPA: Fur family transcriptional regulator [Acidimicrobiia bacterium]
MHISADQLIDALRGEGHRITRARTAICEVLAVSHTEHLDAGAIRERIGADGVDLSTVYRTLDALEEAGVLAHTHLGHGPAVYHLAEEAHHQHLVCERCGLTVALAAEDLEQWTGEIRTRTGFVIEPSHFALTGLCAACAPQTPDPATRA